MIVNEIKIEGKRIILTWTDSDNYKGIKPITQVWAFCFNDEGKMLIGRKSKKHNWNLPGGTPEKNETPEETLRREANEEMSITLDKIKLIGYQKADFPDGKDEDAKRRFPSLKNDKSLYQLRYFATIKKINKQIPDPDSGFLWETRFIEPEHFNKYFKWGTIGEYLVKRVKESFLELKK